MRISLLYIHIEGYITTLETINKNITCDLILIIDLFEMFFFCLKSVLLFSYIRNICLFINQRRLTSKIIGKYHKGCSGAVLTYVSAVFSEHSTNNSRVYETGIALILSWSVHQSTLVWSNPEYDLDQGLAYSCTSYKAGFPLARDFSSATIEMRLSRVTYTIPKNLLKIQDFVGFYFFAPTDRLILNKDFSV